MRGIVVAIVIVFVMTAYMLVAPAAIEAPADHVTDQSEINNQHYNGEDIIDDIKTAVFIRVPLLMLFGFGVVFPVGWYLKREGFLGRRRR